LIPLRRSRPKRRECLTVRQKRISGKLSKNGGDGGTGVYMREVNTSRGMAAVTRYGDFYDFYGVRPEYFGYTPVLQSTIASVFKRILILINSITRHVSFF
jgi:hypothetical protein